jgi:hypothetical protein
MTSVSPRGRVLVLLLVVLLALPWSLAAEPRRAAPPRVAAQATAPALSIPAWIGGWLRSLWGEEGSNIDPNGVAAVLPAPRPAGGTKAGAKIDPDGVATGDIGANIDPNG